MSFFRWKRNFQDNWHHHYRFSHIFRQSNCSNAVTLLLFCTRQSGMAFSSSSSLFSIRPKNKHTVKICTKTQRTKGHPKTYTQKESKNGNICRWVMRRIWMQHSFFFAPIFLLLRFFFQSKLVGVCVFLVLNCFFFLLFLFFFVIWYGWSRLNADDCYIINTFGPIQWRDNFIQTQKQRNRLDCCIEEDCCCFSIASNFDRQMINHSISCQWTQ